MSRYHAAHKALSAPGAQVEEEEAIDQYRDPAKLAAVQAKLRRLVEEAADSPPRGAPRRHGEAVGDIILLKLGLVPDRAEFKQKWLAAGDEMPQFSARPMDAGAWGAMGRPFSRGTGGREQEGYRADWKQRALVHKRTGRPPGNMASVRKSPQDWKIVNLTHKAGERPRSPHFLEWFRYGPEERGKDLDAALDAYASGTPSLRSMFTPVATGADEPLARAMGYVPSVTVSKASLGTSWSTVWVPIRHAMRALGEAVKREENEDAREYLRLRGEGRVARAPGPPPARLYHGTPGRNAAAVAAGGIAPGGATNFPGLSRPDSVYLTDSEAAAADWVYNAYVDGSAEPDAEGNAIASVFEVDTARLDPGSLAPDAGGNAGDWRYAGTVPPDAARLVSEEDYTEDVGRTCEGCGRHPWDCPCEFGEGE